MSIFDDFDIDIDSVKENDFSGPADGVYFWEIASAERRDGSTNHPDNTFFVIEYNLEDENGDAAGTKQEWFTLAVNGDSEKHPAPMSLGFLKARLLSLGLKGHQLKGFTGEEIEGLKGTLQLKTRPGKNGKAPNQNINNLKVDESTPAPKAEPVKRTATRKPAAKPKAAPVEEADDESDEDDNPFG